MKVTLDNRVVLVTGAASGIGRATAIAIAAAGTEALYLTDRHAEGCAALAQELGRSGTKVAWGAFDLMDANAISEVLRSAIGEFGRVDALVNAAGLTTRASVENGTVDIWDTLFAVNARAPFLLMQGVIKDLRRRHAPGAIVNVLSMNAHCGTPELAIYSATKGALLTLTKNAANAHLADRIRVNGLNLGWALTEAEDRMQSETLGKGAGWAKDAAQHLPLGRLLEPAEAARQILFMLSEQSNPMTGVIVDLEQRVLGA
jgi:NAD(P)-dependent dehydrogenase (short-subunit alcohol dehydrogenase family)